MREIERVQFKAELDQAKAWLLGHRPEYFSKLAGMHPERRFTLARGFRLLEDNEGDLRFAIDAEYMTFQEQDGQMVQSFDDEPAVVILKMHESGDNMITIEASIAKDTPVEEQLIEWTERLLETYRQAFEMEPKGEEG
jgi:hypothetical protein